MMTIETIYFILQRVFIAFIPLMIVALGGLITEKSGVTNIALEGLMIIGAFIGILVLQMLEKTDMNVHFIYFLAIIIGGLGGMLFAFLHALASIKFKADQIISATAINIMMPALAIFIARIISGGGGQQIQFTSVVIIHRLEPFASIPVIGDIFFKDSYLSNYLGFILFGAIWLMMQKTRFGLHLRSIGENPHAAQSVGINIFKLRYIAVLLSGFFAGMGGVIFVATTSNEFNAQVAGFGFLAIAVLIFGNWSAPRILFAAFFFAFMRTISSVNHLIPGLNSLDIHKNIYDMMPYVAVMVILVFFSKRSRAPKALGRVFDQGER